MRVSRELEAEVVAAIESGPSALEKVFGANSGLIHQKGSAPWLVYAISRYKVDAVETMIQLGADVNEPQVSPNGKTT